MNYRGLFHRGRILAILSAAALFCFYGGAAVASAADANLDQNEELQWVMGDLSALKTAAQTYYSDSKKRSVPALSDLLAYFDDQSLPPNAKNLYAIRGNSQGWYVGYNSSGLKADTYNLLQENANTLGLVGDDLSTPWKKGNTFIWSSALSLSASASSGSSGGSGSSATNNYTTNNYTTNNYTTDNGSGSTTVVQDNSAVDTAIGVAAVAVGTAALLDIIDDHDGGVYYYNYPGTPWYWHSTIVYRPVYYDRFFDHYYRPLPPPPRPYPRPVYRYNVPHAGYIAPSYRQAMDRAHYNYDPNRNRAILDRHNVDQRVAAQKRIDNRRTVNVNRNTINVNKNRGIQQGQGHLQPRQTPRLKNEGLQNRPAQNRNIQRPQQRQAPQIQRPQERPQLQERPRLENRQIERPQIERPHLEGGGGRLRRR